MREPRSRAWANRHWKPTRIESALIGAGQPKFGVLQAPTDLRTHRMLRMRSPQPGLGTLKLADDKGMRRWKWISGKAGRSRESTQKA
jgi:hypothetical protein